MTANKSEWIGASSLTLQQVLKIEKLCRSYGETPDLTEFVPDVGLPVGWVQGWVGGVMYGIGPDGRAAS